MATSPSEILSSTTFNSFFDMAEVLGIVASVSALIQLVEYGKKFAKALYLFSEQSGSQRKEVQRYAFQAQDFSDCINITQFALEQHFDKYTESPVLRHILSQGILRRLLNWSELIEWRLRKATKHVRTRLSGGNAVLNFFKWWYQKDCILDLFPEMECVKTSLLLLMSTTQLEVLSMERNDSHSDSEKVKSIEGHIKRMKRTIRDHLKSMERLKDLMERVNRPMPTDPFAHWTQSTSSLYESLYPLGRSMVKNGSVPKPKSVSITSSKSSTRTKETYQSSSSDKSMPSVSSAPTRRADSTAEACFYDQEALYKEERRFQRERISSDGSRSAKTTPLVPSVPSAPTRGVGHESSASLKIQEARSVNESHSKRHRSEVLPKRIVEVNTANFEKSIVHSQLLDNGQPSGKLMTGVVNTTLEVNIISIIEAKRLELDVISCEEDKEISFKFDQGKSQRCIGMVSVGIRDKGISQPHATCRMYVLADCHPRLVFGREFYGNDGISKQ
ncbi:hypothetical protein BDP55DRAFT_661856 [Colletotrichum godetiae]|uniref:Uncharacterized protein n=1 Tax=Colletotrichum godetiae TaxID=1209918 RepID=A0AAJ0EYF8_9PEZI|nr:uncharacterized protein BDP55DRAFT_661856 [Colletotrichum godetiae]KAK1676134.1 hypothetical protein BDP55DRAFT_661856 [Colletotrichum godetiae]